MVLYHGFGFPAAAFPAPEVGDRAVKFVAGHAEPEPSQAQFQPEGEKKGGTHSEGPHHGASDNGRELRIPNDVIDRLEGLQGDVAPEADATQPNHFGVFGEMMFLVYSPIIFVPWTNRILFYQHRPVA